MINNIPKNNRKYRPESIGNSLKALNQKFLYKFGKLDYVIHSKWGEIVGSFFVDHSKPIKITSIMSGDNNEGETVYDKFLHVNVTPAAAIEFQHFQNKIIEKINSYLGYKAIKGIKIHQKLVRKENKSSKTKQINFTNIKQKKQEIKNTTPKISDKDLEESILNLGVSIINEEK